MIGKTISHYKILEILGLGLMSSVYKGVDLRLNRPVVLKLLPASLGINAQERDRLIMEAKTASALDHPNICTIYEIDETPEGQMFIAMAFYEGETLREEISRRLLSPTEAIDIMLQIARGLSKAHEKRIVHRDIKPANIIITTEGVVKILDFGVAMLMGRTEIFKDDVIVGTPGYMSPEQASGAPVDHRTDIWSSGSLLYEMLTGRLPFGHDKPLEEITPDVMESLLSIEWLHPLSRRIMQEVVFKALAKNPKDRFQNMDEMAAALKPFRAAEPDLETIRQKAPPQNLLPSVAVLPFKDLSPEQNQDFFCDGLAEEIINTLSRIEKLRVVSRTSSFQFKGKETDIRHIGEKLGVQHILEGSIRKFANKVRINVQLTNVADGFLIWSDQYEQEIGDLFSLQDAISRAIVKTLKIKLVGAEETRVFRRYTDSVDAYTAYLKGRHSWNKRTRTEIKNSVDFYRQAIETDSKYALAYAGLADTYITLGLYSAYPPNKVMPNAKKAALRALQLDEKLAEAHVSLGCIHSVYDWNWKKAGEEFRRSLELNPRYAFAHHWYAINYLIPLKRFDEAIAEIKEALAYDPLSLIINVTVGLVFYFGRQYDTAKEHYLKTLQMNQNFAMAHFFLGQVYVQKAEYQKAIEEFQESLKLFGNSTNMLAALGNAAALAGKKNIAEKVLENLRELAAKTYVSPYDMATIYAGLKDPDNAFRYLKQAVLERAYLLLYIQVDPVMDVLRQDKRFKVILGKMNLLQ